MRYPGRRACGRMRRRGPAERARRATGFASRLRDGRRRRPAGATRWASSVGEAQAAGAEREDDGGRPEVDPEREGEDVELDALLEAELEADERRLDLDARAFAGDAGADRAAPVLAGGRRGQAGVEMAAPQHHVAEGVAVGARIEPVVELGLPGGGLAREALGGAIGLGAAPDLVDDRVAVRGVVAK